MDNPENRGGGGEPPERPPRIRLNIGTILIIIIVIGILIPMIANLFSSANSQTAVSYSTFRTQLQDGNVPSITVQGEKITGTFRRALTTSAQGSSNNSNKNFVTYIPSYGDSQLSQLLESQGTNVVTKPVSHTSVLGLIMTYLPFVLLLFILYSFYRGSRAQGNNLFSVGQNKAKLYRKTTESKTFDDVAGVEGAKGELREIVEFLKSPEQYHKMGAKIPKGVLLVGPPGTGKTLLAKAIAGEADVPFYSITGSDFMELFVGVGASRVRNLFTDARRHKPSIIFIDELDSIGRHRGAGLGGGHDEREQTLNQLLSELDGFEYNDSTIVLAATNRPDILDPALLRPGRFDRQITVDRPTKSDRTEILKIHARNKPIEPGVDLEKVARSTPGFSGADLENLLNEAALEAARKKKTTIQTEDINVAQDKILLGLVRKSLVLTDAERRTVAYHEAGHAVVAAMLPNTEPVHKVTIIPRDRAMGNMQQELEGDKYLYNKEYILDRIAVTLAGRASEKLYIGSITSGAENDLKQATRLARKMVLDWGMSETLGNISLGSNGEHVFLGEDIAHQREFSETTAREIDVEVRTILNNAYDRASELLTSKEEELRAVAEALLTREELLGDEVKRLLKLDGVAKPIN